MSDTREYIGSAEVAKLLGISQAAVRKGLGSLPRRRRGQRWEWELGPVLAERARRGYDDGANAAGPAPAWLTGALEITQATGLTPLGWLQM